MNLHVKLLNQYSDLEEQNKTFDFPFKTRELNLPTIPENEVVRHFINLSNLNFAVDKGFYPLGSCTMKYNPKLNEKIARNEKLNSTHPHWILIEELKNNIKPILNIFNKLEKYLSVITGMDRFTFQPAAGAHGEFTGMLIIKTYLDEKYGIDSKNVVLVPDSAHGTNPASAAMLGFKVITVKSDEKGRVDINDLKEKVAANKDKIAAFMLTNPNTLGIFDNQIIEITKIIHEAGGLMYYDGANLNAILGIYRPADMGFDVIHLNLHKTFSSPHGGGGPGSGPVGVKKFLEKYLPTPVFTEDNIKLESETDIKKIISFYGNFTVLVRSLLYIEVFGNEIYKVAEDAVLNAKWLQKRIEQFLTIPYPENTMHEFVASAKQLKTEYSVTALDIAKALLDNNFHAPTMYFPLIVSEALMIEPTETETLETLEKFADTLKQIVEEAKKNPEKIKQAPTKTPIKRPDEVKAARNPILKWQDI